MCDDHCGRRCRWQASRLNLMKGDSRHNYSAAVVKARRKEDWDCDKNNYLEKIGQNFASLTLKIEFIV
jgi:hypothetical protein